MRWHVAAFPDRWLRACRLLQSFADLSSSFLQSYRHQLPTFTGRGRRACWCHLLLLLLLTALSSWPDDAPLPTRPSLLTPIAIFWSLTRSTQLVLPAYPTCSSLCSTLQSFVVAHNCTPPGTYLRFRLVSFSSTLGTCETVSTPAAGHCLVRSSICHLSRERILQIRFPCRRRTRWRPGLLRSLQNWAATGQHGDFRFRNKKSFLT